MPCPENCPLRAPPSPPSPPASLSPADIFFDPSIQCLLNASADPDECERSRRRLHAQHNVSRYTTCVGVRDACLVGERIVLGPGRSAEAKSLAVLFEPLVRDYVWAQQHGKISARGTFSAVDAQPDRYCSYNATISGNAVRCTGDRDEGDGNSRWIAVDRATTASSVWRADRRPFAVAWWPTYAPGFSEVFGNNVLPLHQLQTAQWLPADAELLPASSWFDYFYQPFSTQALQTLQRLEQRAETRCYRRLAVCKLASFVFDQVTFQQRRQEPSWRPWSAMQVIVAGTPGLRDEARQLAALWRRPQLLRPSGAGRSANVLNVVFIKRTGRRKLANAAHLARVVDGSECLGVRLAASLYTFGAGFAHDARGMREADVLVGSHGADLLNGLFMHAGASLIEARGHLFTSSLGVWAAWYATNSARRPPPILRSPAASPPTLFLL